MSRKVRPAVAASEADAPEVRSVWRSLGGADPTTVEFLRKASRTKPAMYRLVFVRPRRPTVYVKRSLISDLALERTVYQDILPRLPISAPRYLGSCRDGAGATWMFVESVGNRRPADTRPHRVLAAAWLGQLHRSAADDTLAARLPDGGPARYLGHLRAGREVIRSHFGNFALTAEDRAVLTRLLAELDGIEARWPEIERACADGPVTLVHGDLRAKNVRIRFAGPAAALYVLDWEMAGWGVPAADLTSAFAQCQTIRIDRRTYLKAVGDRWPELDEAALRRLSTVGRIFQALAGIEWSGASLRFETQRHLLKPMGSMRVYEGVLVEALAAAREVLRWS